MTNLYNKSLFEIYFRSLELKEEIDQDFITLIEDEIKNRGYSTP